MIPVLDLILHLDTYLNTFIQQYGVFTYALLFLIIFVETGLVIIPFLPGDSLLFVAGTLAAVGGLNIMLLFVVLVFAAILGDAVNYWIGYSLGIKVFSRFIKDEHLERTTRFYHKYGAKTIVLARFIPVIRTFAPFVAGIGRMHYRRFALYNILGALCWVGLLLFLGYFFGTLPVVQKYLTPVILGIILLSLIPLVIEYYKHRKSLETISQSPRNL